jgi:integrase
MSGQHSKRVVVWVQHFADRPYLMLQWHDPVTGKRKSKSAETNNPKEAEVRRADLEADLNAGRSVEASGMRWATFRERFEAEYGSALRTNIRENHRATFNLFEQLCRPGLLRTIDASMVSRFAAAMRQADMLPSTIKVRLSYLKAALRWAVRLGLLPKCPEFPTIKVPRKKPQPVPAESFERLLATANDPLMCAFLKAGWYGGLRFEEAFGLEWEPTSSAVHLDLGRDRIIFPAEVVKAVEDQWVPLDPVLRQALEELVPDPLERTGRVFRFRSERYGLAQGQRRELTSQAVGIQIAKLARRAGVRLTMRTLRRGFGCRWAARVPAQVLSKLMRHASIGMTVTYYANVDDAAEAAILGDKRNTLRNSSGGSSAEGATTDDTSPDPTGRNG